MASADFILIAALFAALLAGAALAALFLGRRRDPAIADLPGRLSQLVESQAATQAELTRTLDAKLADVTRQIRDNLDKSHHQSTQTMTELRERLVKIDEARKNITDLSAQVVGLQEILSNKQARGAFGQVQLNDIVQSALPPSAYRFEAVLSNSRRADCLLQLPNPPGAIAIDAKFPLEAYHALRAATDEASQKAAARSFATDIRNHIRDIAERYIIAGETAESALMFLPSEAVYAELHANFPEIVQQSYRARVWIVSPTTLMATLNTVRAVLKDARMREQANVIQKEVRLLIEDVERLDDRVGKLQKHFDQANEDVRQIRISTEKVSRRGEKIQEIELGEDGSEAPAPALAAEPPKPRLVAEGEK